MNDQYIRKAYLLNIIDGDTLLVQVDLGFGLYYNVTVRLYGINAPEMRGASKAQGIESKNYLCDLLKEYNNRQKQLIIKSHKSNNPYEKYGRWLAEVYLEDGRNLSQEMLSASKAAKMDK